MEKQRPILSVRPQFDTSLAMVYALLATVVGFLPVTFICGTVVFLLLNIIGLGRFVSAGYIYAFFLVVALAGIPPLFYEVRRRALSRTIYNLYGDYIDFQYFHFLINRRRGRVRFEDVTDISQQASALQEQRRLTTIYLYVPTLGYMQRSNFPGLVLKDIPAAKGYMNQIIALLDGSHPAQAQDAAPEQAPPAEPTQATPAPAQTAQAPEQPASVATTHG